MHIQLGNGASCATETLYVSMIWYYNENNMFVNIVLHVHVKQQRHPHSIHRNGGVATRNTTHDVMIM